MSAAQLNATPTGTTPTGTTPIGAIPIKTRPADVAELIDDGTYEIHLEEARAALTWAVETFGSRFTVAASMGDTVLPHLVAATVPGADVFFIDTGYHFDETLNTRDAFADQSLRVRTVLPMISVAEQDAAHGPRLFERDPQRCCAMRKVAPLGRALVGYAAWASGIRRADTAARRDVEVIARDARRDMVKVSPLANWSDTDVARYLTEHDVPRNPLVEQGFLSIGCAPCTRAVRPGEDQRAGRWADIDKTECGLHR
jgi:phosphoadenosine phosphosulfate reductase